MAEYDVVVCGAGAGGMTAALTAAHNGLSVLLCEATEQVGGTTSTSAGTLWLPGNRHGRAAGHDDTVQAAREYLDGLIGPDDHLGRREAFLETADDAIAFLEARCGLAFVSSGRHPDYLERPGAAMCGRAISPAEFDGRRLGPDFNRVRPPLKDFLLLGGMMAGKADVQALVQRYRSWPAFVRTGRLITRYALDRLSYSRGTRLVMGNALVAQMLFGLRQVGVEIRFGTRLVKLEQTGGRVSSVIAECSAASERIGARVAVVLAAGGIGHDTGMRQKMAPTEFDSLTPPAVRGDAVMAAKEVGAVVERQARDYLWQPVSRVPDGAGGYRLFPHLYLDRAKPGLIAVNKAGKRFVNEGCSYHHFVEGMLGPDDTAPSNLPAYLVCDRDFVERYGIGVVPPGTKNLRAFERTGYLVSAPTIVELAKKLDIEATDFAATVAQQNEFASRGSDPQFGKGATAVSRFNGDATQDGNPCLGPIQSAPFCAVRLFPADAASCTGLKTDKDGRVLGSDDLPIDGLYACGNDMASIMRGTYPGPGVTLGPAIVFGYRVGRHASACSNLGPS